MSIVCLRNNKTNEIYYSKLKIVGLQSLNDIVLEVDPAFNDARWDKEPTETIEKLYELRAKQIREIYDYVVVYFSGGGDSTTVLDSFVKNNVPIDEVVVYINTDAEDNPKINGLYALKYLKDTNYPGLVTVVDVNLNVLSRIMNEGTWKNFENFSGLLHSFYRFRIDFYEKHNYITIRARRKNKVAHVFGGVFPIVEKIHDHFYSTIRISDFMLSSTDHENVQFFTSSEMPDVHIKQSYVISNSFQEHLERECSSYKKLIRNEYYEDSDTSKNGGVTETQSNQHGQHRMIMNMYERRSELGNLPLDIKRDQFLARYNQVLSFYNGKSLIKLDEFKRSYQLT